MVLKAIIWLRSHQLSSAGVVGALGEVGAVVLLARRLRPERRPDSVVLQG